VGDVRVTKKTLPLIRQRLGMVFQNPDDQLFMTTFMMMWLLAQEITSVMKKKLRTG